MRFNSVSDGCSHALRYTAVIVLSVGLPLHSIFKTLALFLNFADFFFPGCAMSVCINRCMAKTCKHMLSYVFMNSVMFMRASLSPITIILCESCEKSFANEWKIINSRTQ